MKHIRFSKTKNLQKRQTYRNYLQLLTFPLAIFAFALLFFAHSNTHAQNFNPNKVTSNFLFRSGTLSKTAIQTFFERQNSVLARYSEVVDSRVKSAAQIIYDESKKWNISAEFLMATLEKEQGLLSKTHATEKQLDWAMGYGCFNNQCKDKYQGFANQVAAAAETQDIYRQRTFGFAVGKTTRTHDGYDVTPQNQETANYYIYTPHVGNAPELGVNSRFGGVKLLWKIMTRYFPEQKYPNGLVLTDGTDYWRIENDEKRKFISEEIYLLEHKNNPAIHVFPKDLDSYENGTPIRYVNNTLVRIALSNQVYLLQNNTKRLIATNSALAKIQTFRLAINGSEVPTVPHDHLNAYDDGHIITDASQYPQGKFFQTPDEKLYFIKDGKYSLVLPEIKNINSPNESVETINESELSAFVDEGNLALKSGTFVKNSDGDVYLISDGKRLKIIPEVLSRVFGGDKIQSAIVVSDEVLNAHEAGLTLSYIDETIQDSPTPLATGFQSAQQNFDAQFVAMNPSDLVLLTNEERNIEVVFKNTGNTTWSRDNIFARVGDSDVKYLPIEDSIVPNQTAHFNVSLTAPEKIGINTQRFFFFKNENGIETQITSRGKFILIKKGSSANLLEHNLPIALKNYWGPVDIKMTVKNASDQTWYSPKTALTITDGFGGKTPLYDPNDWVRSDVAAVPINKQKIEPNQDAIFKFTLNPKGMTPGVHTYILEIKRLDAKEDDQQVYIDGQQKLLFRIRIDEN